MAIDFANRQIREKLKTEILAKIDKLQEVDLSGAQTKDWASSGELCLDDEDSDDEELVQI